jgi:hypothetical protein
MALGLVLLGASIVFAGQALDRGGSGAPGAGGSSPADGPPPAPALLAAGTELTSAAAVDVSGTLPGGLDAGSYTLRIYRNDALVRERGLPRKSPWTVRNVPLKAGRNSFAAAIAGAGGESLHSAAVVITRDSAAPPLSLTLPESDAPTTNGQATVAGLTEAGAAVTVANRATGQSLDLTADAGGRFGVIVGLELGSNRIELTSRDALGNEGRLRLTIERIVSHASVKLTLSPTELHLDELPVVIEMVALIEDAAGRPAEGAQVVFSISPPGQPTATYTTTSAGGVAEWRNFRLPRDGTQNGRGQVTVMVTLADDELLTESGSFSVR